MEESIILFQAQTIKESLIQDLAGISAFDHKFRRKGIVITTKTNASVILKIVW